MVRLPWAMGNLLIAFTVNDIIKELWVHVSGLSLVSLSSSFLDTQNKTAEREITSKVRPEMTDQN